MIKSVADLHYTTFEDFISFRNFHQIKTAHELCNNKSWTVKVTYTCMRTNCLILCHSIPSFHFMYKNRNVNLKPIAETTKKLCSKNRFY